MANIENPDSLLLSVPNFSIVDQIYSSQLTNLDIDIKKQILNDILKTLQNNSMAPFYSYLCKEQVLVSFDEKIFTEMSEKNKIEIDKIENELKEVIESYGDLERRNVQYKKTVFYVGIGDKKNSLIELQKSIEITTGSGFKLELFFLGMRIGFFWNDISIIENYLLKSEEELKKAGDWERKNRLRVYQALLKLYRREFNQASTLLLEALATFTATEIISYEKLILYTIFSSLLTENRPTLKLKLLNAPEILKIALQPSQKYLIEYIESFYYARYSKLFRILLVIIDKMQSDRFLSRHYRYYLRNMRLRAYKQYLEPFQSTSIESMSIAFGMSEQFLEQDIVSFISSSKLPCTIDKVRRTVICNNIDNKLSSYNEIIQKGDLLLNRLQKLFKSIQV